MGVPVFRIKAGRGIWDTVVEKLKPPKWPSQRLEKGPPNFFQIREGRRI